MYCLGSKRKSIIITQPCSALWPFEELQCLAFPHWLRFTATEFASWFPHNCAAWFSVEDFTLINILSHSLSESCQFSICYNLNNGNNSISKLDLQYLSWQFFSWGLETLFHKNMHAHDPESQIPTTVFLRKMQWIMLKFPGKNWDLISQYSTLSITQRMIVSCNEIPLANMHSGLISVAAHPWLFIIFLFLFSWHLVRLCAVSHIT